MDQKFLTVHGRLTIPQLTEELGLPTAILKYAKVEAKTGQCANATIEVERFIDGELVFSKDVVIPGISKALILLTDYSGISIVYVRHPSYNPATMVKANEKEILSVLPEGIK
jgi:hypothetical protein